MIYQVYPRSFADADGDGLGDLPGVTAHLDRLAELGVDAVWLSPFYPSPQVDFGYDVADHENVDPQFGTLAAFVTVCIGILVLRRTRPDLPRPFRAPWPWFTCIAGALVCAYMMYSLGTATWWRLLVWTVVGIVVYAVYGYQHSCVRQAANGATASPRPA